MIIAKENRGLAFILPNQGTKASAEMQAQISHPMLAGIFFLLGIHRIPDETNNDGLHPAI